MKTQEFFHDLEEERLSMSENPLVASDLLLSGHMTRYSLHFKKLDSARHKYRF